MPGLVLALRAIFSRWEKASAAASSDRRKAACIAATKGPCFEEKKTTVPARKGRGDGAAENLIRRRN
ncbi:hypothetical protein, partial [Xanthomonas vesicatoria]